MKTILQENYKVIIYDGMDELNTADDNVDVEVVFTSGKRFSATFFTIQNILTILNRHKVTKECGNGLYFWASNMITVKKLSYQVILDVITGLIKDNEFEKAFLLLNE